MSAAPTDKRDSARLRLAADIGGTFTDVVAFDESTGALSFGKALSTHDRLVDGIEDATEIAGTAFDEVRLFLHGSTIAINTLLERTGATTALLITEGFRDIYEIGRINRPDAYNLFFQKHEPLIPRSRRFEVAERLRASGDVHRPLDEATVRTLARKLKEKGVEAVAIVLLHSYRNPAHERRVKEIIEQEIPHAFVTASHELSQEYREFERTSTVAANAYIGPRVQTYLGEIESRLQSAGFSGDFYAVQSSGGLFSIHEARRYCVRMLESGPAAGVIGAGAICAQIGLSDAIAFDMGGTTAKAGVVCQHRPLMASAALVGGYERALPIQIPMIDISEVGTGGGSIAFVAEGNAMRVGPRSAGSMPGPACYGRGGSEPTVTDANLVLGRLDAEHFLGGTMQLDVAAAEQAIRNRLAAPLGLDMIAAAEGIVRIAVTSMSYAVKRVTTERGLDAGAFAMIVYGGAGPLHASGIARELGIKRVIIPFAPGHFSAYGMLFSDLRYDFVRSCFERLATVSFETLGALYRDMEDQGRAAIAASNVPPQFVETKRFADMRYVGQEHAVTVELPLEAFASRDRDAIKREFDAVHRQRYGTSAPNEPADLVSVRSAIVGVMRKPLLPEGAPRPGGSGPPVQREKRTFFRDRGFIATPVYTRIALLPGDVIAGPALIEEHASTTVVAPGDQARIDACGNVDITIGSVRP
jgi:N-methylhydantoinase A